MTRRLLVWEVAAFTLLAIGLMLVGVLPAAADGVSIYPASVQYEEALRGGEYFKTIGVVNNDDIEHTFSLEAAGPLAPWLSFVEAEDRTKEIHSMSAPANARVTALVRLRVPQDAANGTYQGILRTITQSSTDQASATGATVGVGAELVVAVTITGEQKINGSLIDASVIDIEIGFPMRLKSTIQNSGNVQVNPDITLEVLDASGALVQERTFPSVESIFPNEIKTLTHELDSEGMEAGDYTARASVSFGDLRLGSQINQFSILPIGSLTRKGDLKSLNLVVQPDPGGLGKLDALFVNIGQIDTRAKFLGELYFGGQLKDVLSSEELLVPVGQEVTLASFIRADEAGEYTVKGKVNYEGKETEIRELQFSVAAPVSTNAEAATAPPAVEPAPAPQGVQPESSSPAPAAGASEPQSPEPQSAVPDSQTEEAVATRTAGTKAVVMEQKGLGIWLWVIIGAVAVVAALGIFSAGRLLRPRNR
ncbi:MAG: hypothetical protein ACE5Q6_03365 [Dehalococcoidia bacterium]